MKNWGNWSYGQLVSAINTARADGDEWLSISQEHTDAGNDWQVKRWLTEMGLEFITEFESTTIKVSK